MKTIIERQTEFPYVEESCTLPVSMLRQDIQDAIREVSIGIDSVRLLHKRINYSELIFYIWKENIGGKAMYDVLIVDDF